VNNEEGKMMMKPNRDFKPTLNKVRTFTIAFVISALCAGSVFNGWAQTKATVSPEQSKAILMRMAEFIGKTQSFSVNVRDSYDVYQASGQKIEFNETRKITVARPNRVHIDVEESNGAKGVFMFDGNDLTMWSPTRNVYAQTPKPGSIDDAVIYFVHDLGMRLPFAVLLLATAPQELEQRTTSLDYVEKTSILGTSAHHLAGRTESVDYQVWIADGDKPLLLRLVLTYPASEGQPQFRAQFSDWNLAPDTSASMFTFAPPQGIQRIAFLEQIPKSAVPHAVKPIKRNKATKSGGQK